MDLFPQETSCYRTIRRMVAAGELLRCGSLPRETIGRPESVLSTWKVSPRKLAHEWMVKQIVHSLAVPCLREPDANPRLRADADLLGKRTVHLEADNATMTLADVLGRLRLYATQENPVVIVTRSARRMEGIRACTDGARLDGVLFLATLSQLLTNGLIEDRFGETMSFKNLLNKSSGT